MARTTKTSSNNTELSSALTRAEIAETLLADARRELAEMTAAHEAMVANRNKLFAEREALNEKLALARKLFVEQRTELCTLRASRPARKAPTEAQIAYRADAAQRSAAFAAQRAQRAALSAQYFAAHPDARSASDADIQQWAQQAQ